MNANEYDLDPAILAIKGDRDYGAYLSAQCTACHQVSGSVDGIASIINWPTEDFVRVLHAYKNGQREHQIMQMMVQGLSNTEIAALAAYFENIQ